MCVNKSVRGVLATCLTMLSMLLVSGVQASDNQATFDFGRLKLQEGTNLDMFLAKVAEHEEKNSLLPSAREDLVAIFKQYDFDQNGELNATEMLVGCMKPLTPEQVEAYKAGKKKKGGGGGKVPGPVETGCTGSCNCDYISGGVGSPAETETSDYGAGSQGFGNYPGSNQNCFAAGDPNCHCHCNTGLCAAGGT